MAFRLQFGNLISFGTVEVGISWHGNIVFLFGDKRISYPPTMLHFASEFTPDSIQPASDCEDVEHGQEVFLRFFLYRVVSRLMSFILQKNRSTRLRIA